MSAVERLERRQFFAAPRERLFPFFADASNLQAITPPGLDFRILTPAPIAMHAGAVIEYRLKLFAIPFRWRTRIEAYEPPRRFVDVQLRGPYRHWVHEHEFHEVDGGTWMLDSVDYELPLGPLGQLAHALFVRKTLERIFDFRRARLADIFPSGAAPRTAISTV